MRIFSLLLIFIFFSCGTESEIDDPVILDGGWNTINVEKNEVNVTGSSGNFLYYVSDNKLYQLTFDGLNLSHNELLFKAENARIADFVNMQNGDLLLGLRYEDSKSDEPKLFISVNRGETWVAIDENAPEEAEHFVLKYLATVSVTGANDRLIAHASSRILESKDEGASWNKMYLDYGFSLFLYSDEKHSDHIWTGGDTPLMSPHLAKTTDGGKSWKELGDNIDFGSDAFVRNVILHRQNSDWILAGLGGPVGSSNVIRKTTDGGENWETVLKNTGVHTFTRSKQNPELIYASGRDATGKLFFAYTSDFGDTWEKQIFEEGPERVTTNDMDVMMIDGKEVIFFGTDKGLFTFVIDE